MHDLGGREAVARLERRGGQVEGFPRVGGRAAPYSRAHRVVTYNCVGREAGATVVQGPDRRWLLRTDANRADLARDMEATRRLLSTTDAGNPAIAYWLVHRGPLDDPGIAQVGCFLSVVSIIVGFIVGIAVAWIATGSVAVGLALRAPILGFVIGYLGVVPVGSVAVYLPALRDRQAEVAWRGISSRPGS